MINPLNFLTTDNIFFREDIHMPMYAQEKKARIFRPPLAVLWYSHLMFICLYFHLEHRLCANLWPKEK